MSRPEPEPGAVHPSRDVLCERLASAMLAIDRAAATTNHLEAEIEICFAIADLRRALGYIARAAPALADLWADAEEESHDHDR